MNWDQRMAAAYSDSPDDPGPDVTELQPAPPETLNIAVIGSSGWLEMIVVQAVLLGWAKKHAGHPVILWTTDAPVGAELEAREFASRSGWSFMTVSIDEMHQMTPAITYAFVTPGSEADEFARDLATRRPVQLFSCETLTPRSRWSKW